MVVILRSTAALAQPALVWTLLSVQQMLLPCDPMYLGSDCVIAAAELCAAIHRFHLQG